jgi:hypothetical protein
MNNPHRRPAGSDRFQALALIALLALFAVPKAGLTGALIVFVVLAALLSRPSREALGLARANTVDSELNLNTILDSALRAFKSAVIPLTAFATIFRDVVLKGTNKVEVPYFPLVTAASKDFDTCYVFDDSYAQDKREVTINKRKYQNSLSPARDRPLPAAQAREDRRAVWRETRLRCPGGHPLRRHRR